MDKSGQKRLTEPLLPHGNNSVIDTIVEERYPDDFVDDDFSYIIQEDPSPYDLHQAIGNNLDFNTSVSSTSTGSYVDSTVSENIINGNHIIGSVSSGQSQKAFVSDSSSSFHSSGSCNYRYDNQHGIIQEVQHHLSQNPFYALTNGCSNACVGGSSEISDFPTNACVGGSSEISDFSTTSEEDNDPLKDIEPTIIPVPNFDVSDYLPHNLTVEFVDLKQNRIFEKMQSRKDKKARQRIMDGKVKISVGSDKQITELKVWVRREPQAAALCNDKNGDVELKKPTLLRHTTNKWFYVVDLDSVYEGKERPVYELAKVEMNDRNIFELIAQVTFQNGQSSKKINSKSFLIRTHKRPYQDEAPLSSSSSGNKRPNTWSHSSGANHKSPRYSPHPSYVDNDVDSSASLMDSSSESSTSNTMNLDKVIVDHLEAQRAHIDHLTFGYIKTRRGDIAYHIKLTDQARDKKMTEGVVVGFFPSEGKTKIEPLSSQNVEQAVMAGVISRSAYVEAEVPEKSERGSTDAVCVIGMIGVQVQGSVLTGERIYTSSDRDGIAIPESHLPIGSFVTQENTMLGMAMEPHTSRKPGDFSLVRCFVCIVLGISSQQVAREVQNVLDSMETNLKSEVRKSSKKTWRRIYCLSALALFLLVTTGFLLYQLFAPGTFYRYWRCSIGAKPNSFMKYKFNWDGKEVLVHGLEFDFHKLNDKLKETVETINIKQFRNTTTGVRYYLNVDHCAYGGETDGGFWGKTVKGGLILVNACPCDTYNKPIFKYLDGNQWCAYVTKKPIKGTMEWMPRSCTEEQKNFNYPTFNETYKDKNITKCHCGGP